ncbi:DNA-binding response regulator MtrA [compost metagenome]
MIKKFGKNFIRCNKVYLKNWYDIQTKVDPYKRHKLSYMSKRKTVLIFEDDTIILEVITVVLTDLGFHVEVSETSHDIIQKVETTEPNLILMDNWIPNIGGVEATRLLKADDRFKHIPVIYVSANNDIESLAARAGADDFLSKPFDLDDLEDIVNKHI